MVPEGGRPQAHGGVDPADDPPPGAPAGSVAGTMRITEQGEIISQQFGLLPVAERTLEVTLAGALMHGFVSLEAAGGFAMPQDLDESYRRLIDGFERSLTQ